MKQPDVRIDPRNDFSVKFEHQPQHPVRGGVLWPEVDRKIAEIVFGHRQTFGPAFSSPGRIG